MKKIIILIFLAVLFIGCSDPGSSVTTLPTPVIPTTPPPEIPDNSITNDVILALYDGSTLRYYDGESVYDAHVGKIKPAGSKKLSLGNVLYYFDEKGKSVASRWLVDEPDGIIAVESDPSKSRSYTAYEDDIYTLITVEEDEAYASGATHDEFTRVFINGEEQGLWNYNKWSTDHVIETASGHILVFTKDGHWKNLTDSIEIDVAYPGGIIFHKTAKGEGYIYDENGRNNLIWEENYFDNAKFQKAGEKWYTNNGYIYGNGTVQSKATIMYDFINYPYPDIYNGPWPEKPLIIPAGVRFEHGEEVIYWVELVTAKLYRFIPSINQVECIVELFTPPMSRYNAQGYYKNLKPQIIDDGLYYHDVTTLKKYDFASGVISNFAADQEVIVW
jgi:hypothetical protein